MLLQTGVGLVRKYRQKDFGSQPKIDFMKISIDLCIANDEFCNVLQVRKLEFFIAFLVAVMAGCFFVELGYAKPKASEVLKGLFVPQLKGDGATGLAISLLGAMVMP